MVETLNSKFQLPNKREAMSRGEVWRIKISTETVRSTAELDLRAKSGMWMNDGVQMCTQARREGALNLFLFRLVSLRIYASSWWWWFQDLPALIAALQGVSEKNRLGKEWWGTGPLVMRRCWNGHSSLSCHPPFLPQLYSILPSPRTIFI